MSDSKSTLMEEARKIAFETVARRELGDQISDEQVLAEHPHLGKYLDQHLRRLRQLRTARQSPLQKTEVNTLSSAPFGSESSNGDIDPSANLRITSIVDDERDPNSFRSTAIVDQTPEQGDRSPGLAIEKTELFRPTNRPPMGVLKLYLDGSPTFSPIPVFTDSFLIGRTDGALRIEHDPRVSGKHVEIQRRRIKDAFAWYLVDQDSTNGTFVRVDHAVLSHGDEILIGRERYRFICENGRIGLGVVSDHSSDVWYFKSNLTWIGRDVEDAIETIRNDPFADPSHAIIRARSNNQWVIVNNDSLNGLWYRISEIRITGNCSFQVGEQRFGFRP